MKLAITISLYTLGALAALLLMPLVMLLAVPWMICTGRSLRSCCREANALSGFEEVKG